MQSSGIRKDPITGFVMNEDHNSLERYRLERKKVIEQINMQSAVLQIQKDIEDIKNVLQYIKDRIE